MLLFTLLLSLLSSCNSEIRNKDWCIIKRLPVRSNINVPFCKTEITDTSLIRVVKQYTEAYHMSDTQGVLVLKLIQQNQGKIIYDLSQIQDAQYVEDHIPDCYAVLNKKIVLIYSPNFKASKLTQKSLQYLKKEIIGNRLKSFEIKGFRRDEKGIYVDTTSHSELPNVKIGSLDSSQRWWQIVLQTNKQAIVKRYQ